MSENNEPEPVWDEYDWERFLQQQDRKTELYMDLLEKYIDHPERDQIIAQEMGWSHFMQPGEPDPMELSLQEEDEQEEEFAEEQEGEEVAESFELHPLYQASFALTVWLDQLLEEVGDVENLPCAVKLATNCAVTSAKLAAALSDDDVDEIGMTIAYLKRALKAITQAIDASLQFGQEAQLDGKKRVELHYRLFEVRDGIILLMGEFRGEWRRRFGN
ncbi:MAG: hypothetical protein WCP06_04910 [Verrucomicrobiota bacterium]